MYLFSIVFVFLCVYVLLLRRKKCVKVQSPPLYSGALPIIGHAHKMLGDSQFFYHRVTDMAKECNEKGGVMVLKIGFNDYYVITDPDDFTTAGNQCLKAHFTHEFIQPWLGDGLVSGTDVPIWKRHRKLLSPAFSQQVFDGFLYVFNTLSKKYVEELASKADKGPFHHEEHCNRLALEVICQTSFGITANEVENFETGKYMAAVKLFFHFVTLRIQQWWLHNDFLYSLSQQKKDRDTTADYLNGISKSVLSLKKKKILAGDIEYNDTKYKAFIDLVLELADKGQLTDEEVYQEMNTMIAAGYETTGNTLMFALLLLGSYIDVQKKVYEELQSVFGDSTRDVEKQDLSKLVYLEAVLKETLRYFSITPSMFRNVETDVKLKNYTMPAGSNCLLFVCGLHRHPSWGPDVEKFRPERWLENTSTDLSKAFAGFGVGKRLCLGQNFALMSLKTTIAHLLRRFYVTSDVTKLVLKVDPLLKAVSGHEIALQMRTPVFKDRPMGS